MRSWSTEQQSFLEKLQESQNMWIEEQQEKHQQREERLLSRFMEESSRSNERLLGQLGQPGLSSLKPLHIPRTELQHSRTLLRRPSIPTQATAVLLTIPRTTQTTVKTTTLTITSMT